MTIRTLTVLICLSILQPLYSQTKKINIAVNNLSGENISPSTVSIISDRLRVVLQNTGEYRVMERSQMATVLKEQGFQNSGACNDASCLVEIGQLLGVDKMISGSIGQIEDNFYTITLRIINISTGEVEHSIVKDFEGDMKELVTKGVGEAVDKLLSSSKGGIVEKELGNKKPKKIKKPKIVLSPEEQKIKRKKVSKWIRRVSFGGIAAGAFIAGVLVNKKAQRLHNDYMNIDTYNQDELNAAYDKVKAQKTLRNVLYIVGGASSVGFIISIPF